MKYYLIKTYTQKNCNNYFASFIVSKNEKTALELHLKEYGLSLGLKHSISEVSKNRTFLQRYGKGFFDYKRIKITDLNKGKEEVIIKTKEDHIYA